MVELLRHLQRLNVAQKLLGAAALLAAFSLWMFDLRVSARQTALLDAHMISTRAQWESRHSRSEAARTALDEAARIHSTIAHIAPRISPEILTEELNVLARNTGVRRLSIQNSLAGNFHSLTDCPVIVDLQGDMPAVMRFLRDAETGPRPARLQSVKMKAIDPKQSQFEAQASLDFYGSVAQ